MKVSLVLLIVNNFTNMVIKDSSIKVFIKNEKPPIFKNDGYYIFTDINNEKVDIITEGIKYNRLITTIDLSKLDKNNPIIKLRIQPSKNYCLPTGTTCLSGKGNVGEKLQIILIESELKLKLFADYENLETISIYNPKEEDLEGLKFAITKDNENCKIFKILNKLEGSTWNIDKKLNEKYLKLESSILPVYNIEIDENGSFFLPIKEISEKKDKMKIFIENKGKYDIEKGKTSIIDLR